MRRRYISPSPISRLSVSKSVCFLGRRNLQPRSMLGSKGGWVCMPLNQFHPIPQQDLDPLLRCNLLRISHSPDLRGNQWLEKQMSISSVCGVSDLGLKLRAHTQATTKDKIRSDIQLFPSWCFSSTVPSLWAHLNEIPSNNGRCPSGCHCIQHSFSPGRWVNLHSNTPITHHQESVKKAPSS